MLNNEFLFLSYYLIYFNHILLKILPYFYNLECKTFTSNEVFSFLHCATFTEVNDLTTSSTADNRSPALCSNPISSCSPT